MSILDFARLVVYRFHEKGLEVFLIKNNLESDPEVWKLPDLDMERLRNSQSSDEYIELNIEGEKLIAIEGDWHNIPSIRGLLKHDVKVVKHLVKEAVPGIEKGAFVAFKESVKKLMPKEYKAIKELKEILIESNSIRNL
jgi:hypothetical protein